MTKETNTAVATNTEMIAIPDMLKLAYSEGMNVSGRVFYSCLSKLQGRIPFDSEWSNGTGYFDKATGVNVPVGEWRWSHDVKSNRYLILIGTRFGTVCIFERYSHGGKAPVIVSNVPKKGYVIWQMAGLNGQLNERVLSHALGDPDFPSACNNIGMQVEQMSQLFLKFND